MCLCYRCRLHFYYHLPAFILLSCLSAHPSLAVDEQQQQQRWKKRNCKYQHTVVCVDFFFFERILCVHHAALSMLAYGIGTNKRAHQTTPDRKKMTVNQREKRFFNAIIFLIIVMVGSTSSRSNASYVIEYTIIVHNIILTLRNIPAKTAHP